jgi:hypothetical protein
MAPRFLQQMSTTALVVDTNTVTPEMDFDPEKLLCTFEKIPHKNINLNKNAKSDSAKGRRNG